MNMSSLWKPLWNCDWDWDCDSESRRSRVESCELYLQPEFLLLLRHLWVLREMLPPLPAANCQLPLLIGLHCFVQLAERCHNGHSNTRGHESSASLQFLTFEYLTQKVNTDLRSQSFIEQKRCENYLYLCAIILVFIKWIYSESLQVFSVHTLYFFSINLIQFFRSISYLSSSFTVLPLKFIIGSKLIHLETQVRSSRWQRIEFPVI